MPVRVLTDGVPELRVTCKKGWTEMVLLSPKSFLNPASKMVWLHEMGGLWKDVFLKVFEECQPRNKEEVNELCDRRVCELHMCTNMFDFL